MEKYEIYKTGKTEDGTNWNLIGKIQDGNLLRAFIKTVAQKEPGQNLEIPENLDRQIKWEIVSSNERHKKIINVFSRIKKGRQLVGFEVENYPYLIYLTAKQIKDNTQLEINEIDMLIGSTIRPEFYQRGEKRFDGEITNEENKFIKDFWITLNALTIEEFKLKNRHNYINLEVIEKVFTFNRNSVQNVGIKTKQENTYFVTSKRLSALTNLEPSEFHILESSFVNPEFYINGEIMAGGNVCYGDNKIIKALNLRFMGNFEEMHEHFENYGHKYYSSRKSLSRNSHYSYDEYNGPSDGYGGYLDDDFTNDVLDGHPDAYWNID